MENLVREVRRRVGLLVVIAMVIGTAIPLVVDLAGTRWPFVADRHRILPVFLAEIAVGLAFRTRMPSPERLLPWLCTAAVVYCTEEPWLSHEASPFVHLPALAAVALGSPVEVLGMEVVTIAGLALRGPGPSSAYLQTSYLVGSVYLAGGMVMVRVFFGMMYHRMVALSRRMRIVLESAQDGILIDGGEAGVRFVSPAAVRILGAMPSADLTALAARVHPDDQAEFVAALAQAQEHRGAAADVLSRIRHSAGHWLHLEIRFRNLLGEPEVRGILATLVDVTDREGHEAEHRARLEHMATHDALTGLPNRVQVRRHLAELLENPQADGAGAAVAFLDLDNFKLINDSLGHDVGDRMVQVIASRLRDTLSSRDLVCRFGGDEFLAVLAPRTSRVDTLAVIDQCMTAVRESVAMDGQRVTATASIGLSFLRTDHLRPESVIREADAALYAAKSRGRDTVAVFDEPMQAQVQRRHELGQALRVAIRRRELRCEYQPRFGLSGGRLEGFEALVRWDSELGAVSPVEFIQIAEETGMILPIGEWVLLEACRQLHEWRSRFPSAADLHVAVNLSVHQIRTPADGARFVSAVRDVLHRFALPPHQLEIELTESALLPNATHVIATLHALRRLGVRLAVDDFGTGYSSLAYLRRFPVDILKVDRAFVSAVGTDAVAEEIISFVVALARALDGHAVAEGIETADQLARLTALGVDSGQGYLFAKPKRPAECEPFVRGGTTPHIRLVG